MSATETDTVRRAARPVWRPTGAATRPSQAIAYPDKPSLSTPGPLEQAAEVLCLLSVLPLSPVERAGFSVLFERRLRRAYAGEDCVEPR
jgi:hypothetical protein